MSDTTILRDLLSRHDPRAGATVSAEQRNQARINVLAAQHADAAPAGARSRWVLAFGAVAAAAGLAAVAVFNGGLGGEPAVPAAYADPPPPLNIRVDSLEDGSAMLLELAEKAEEQSPPADEGDVAT
ncbi:hypothetical protein [Allosalinactinospora lopnorensis]|uniref:hypothetical protein n=1 Tax=Allosalinactinospora lopnorensis TaxID=1352348 RepID=UPI000623BBE4|nr:hypothetical protein [Allosalinactinospora lopnorensis]